MTRRSLIAIAFARPSLKITKLELIPVRVTERTAGRRSEGGTT